MPKLILQHFGHQFQSSQITSFRKSDKNKPSKSEPAAEEEKASAANGTDVKSDVADVASDSQVIRNQEGKLVYSKFDFALSPGARAALQQKVGVDDSTLILVIGD